jgi:hypothetical protein
VERWKVAERSPRRMVESEEKRCEIPAVKSVVVSRVSKL